MCYSPFSKPVKGAALRGCDGSPTRGLPFGGHRLPVDFLSSKVHIGNPARIPDVIEGIGVEHDEIRTLA
jgi:hypothetical protein